MGNLPLDSGIELLKGGEEASLIEAEAVVLKKAGLMMLFEATGDGTRAEEEEVLGDSGFEFVSFGTVSVSIGNEEAVFDAVTASTGVDEVNELVSKATD